MVATLFLFAGATACNKPSSDREAIRGSIEQHLRDNRSLNMAAMDMDVKQVIINGDQAQAQVEFRLKQGGASMQVVYNLERRDGVWSVMQGQPSGGQIAHPPMDKAHETGPSNNNLPHLHMSLGGFSNSPASQADPSSLPPGHPAIGDPSPASQPDKTR
jgi:hypothetical protein